MDLRGADFTDVNLKEADFRNSIFVRPDLNVPRFNGANLSKAKLSRVSLSGMDFSGANLTGADLIQAELPAADLTGANFTEAELYRTDLTGADLTGADLTGARLTGTIFSMTNLTGAEFNNAFLHETVFNNIDLSVAKSLDQCNHIGPSVIDLRTLRQSWPLPLSFLRGCGLDDVFIEYLPSLMGQAIQFYSLFISYSSQDDDFAQRLHADLQSKGVRCWFAPEDLKIGSKIRPAIHDAIRLHDKLLLILSEHSVRSQWVEDEVERALDREHTEGSTILFPIRLDDSVMESDTGWASSIRRTRHIGDFRAWKDHDAYHRSFERLLRDLKATG